MKVNILQLPHAEGIPLPSYATPESAGMDLRAAVNETVVLQPSCRVLIPTGVVLAIPSGYNGEIRSRSGLANEYGVVVLNSPGTVDSDYRGEVKVVLVNMSKENFGIERGMRIAQLVIQKCEKIDWNVVDSLDETVRATGGYGSTGVR
ncbi:MAG: dUTP diphosphatase [Holosporaceae bacterium]|nr:dUTP diphosphatase [Holosporaceae bacterium]